MRDFGINLTGGGARGAYQAGVLLALGELLEAAGLNREKNPFTIWVGSSAGAINATFCAAGLGDIQKTTKALADLWKGLTPQQIYETDMLSLSANSAKWIRDLTFGPLFKKKLAQHLLNTDPLLKLLENKITYSNIQKNIDKKYFHALTSSSYCYRTGQTVSHLQTNLNVHWERPRRRTEKVKIEAKHILASCSIPLLFPPTEINGDFLGDGGFRNMAPLSSTIQLGAKKILLIGVRFQAPKIETTEPIPQPGVAKIAGSMLNALFMDNLDLDIERLTHINEILDTLGSSVITQRSDYSPVDLKVIRPSENITKIAEGCGREGFPKMLKFLLGGLGTIEETADLSSYLLFENRFTSQLIDLGYADVMKQKDELLSWLQP